MLASMSGMAGEMYARVPALATPNFQKVDLSHSV